ncbi:uncharacterized protein ACRADG_013033 [Cochliomyia hominivorax]
MIKRKHRKKCIMGCSSAKVHRFPADPKRREEWSRILGVFPKQKIPFICNAHFSNFFINGNHLSRYAVPNPPESKTANPTDSGTSNAQEIMNIIKSGSKDRTNKNHTKTGNSSNSGISDAQEIKNTIKSISQDQRNKQHTRSICVKDSSIITPDIFEDDNSETDYEESLIDEIVMENVASDTIKIYENIANPLLSTHVVVNDNSQNNQNADNYSVEEIDICQDGINEAKVEEFEMRKGSTNDMIIQGRYVQTNDCMIVTYTPPHKWSLQEQIERLDTACHSQLRQIKYLNKENERLRREMGKYERFLYNMRKLQTKNRYLMAELKMYKLEEAKLKKRKKNKLKKIINY